MSQLLIDPTFEPNLVLSQNLVKLVGHRRLIRFVSLCCFLHLGQLLLQMSDLPLQTLFKLVLLPDKLVSGLLTRAERSRCSRYVPTDDAGGRRPGTSIRASRPHDRCAQLWYLNGFHSRL